MEKFDSETGEVMEKKHSRRKLVSVSDIGQALNDFQEYINMYQDDGIEFGDDELLAIMEHNTDVNACAYAVLCAIDEDDIMINGLKEHIAKMSARKSRLEVARDKKKSILKMVLEITGVNLKFPTATVSYKKPSSLIDVKDEELIPSEFWEEQPPRLCKKKILGALIDGKKIPGAALSYGSASITIRRN